MVLVVWCGRDGVLVVEEGAGGSEDRRGGLVEQTRGLRVGAGELGRGIEHDDEGGGGGVTRGMRGVDGRERKLGASS